MFNSECFDFKILSVLHLTFPASERISPSRPYNVLVFRTRGDAEVFTDDYKYRLKKNDVTFVPSNLPYQIKTISDEEVIVIHFQADVKAVNKIKILHARYPEVFDDLFQKLLVCWNNKPLGFEYRIDSLFLTILENLEKQSIEENADSIFINIQLAIDQMHASFSDPDFSIRALAERLGYCNSYFRRIFKNVTQKSPRDYLVELRIEHAVNLLQSGYYNVEQVSERCGFNSAKYFSTAFKAVTGMPPSKMLP